MITVQSNVVDIEQMLDELAGRARDLRPLWPRVGQWFAARQKTVFATRNAGQWAPSDPATRNKGVLVRTGALRRSVTSATPIYASATTARFGARAGGPAYYGLFHARGSGVPIRPPVPALRSSEQGEIVEIVAEYLTEGL